jgi:hypothetical protein
MVSAVECSSSGQAATSTSAVAAASGQYVPSFFYFLTLFNLKF